ncbi:MAG: DUF3837 domain-containing protein [Lachnospiraceae bacterium]|nr:DUF3837 domain-containing protein [Lachnospiraceae bacterium]
MVPLLAAQSVQIKCKMNKSVMTGNYEFYYAAGLYAGYRNIDVDEYIAVKDLFDLIAPLAKEDKTEDSGEKYLCKLLYEYRIDALYDEQMPELLKMGLEDGKKKISLS